MNYQIEVQHEFESFFEDPRLWDSLSDGIVMRESAWLGPWWRHFGVGHEAYVVVARDGSGNVRGLLPLYRKRTAGGRTLANLGDGSVCTDYVSVLSRPDESQEVGQAIGKFLAAIARDTQHGWDLLEIDGIAEGDTGMVSLAKGLTDGDATLHTLSEMKTWFKPADANWADHLKHHGKTQRRRMRRMCEKIADDGPVERLVAETEKDVEEFLGALIEMHQHRWNSVGEPGSYAEPEFRAFIMDVAKEFLRRGRLYLNLLRHEGRNLGAELNLIGENRILYCYSAGYNIDLADMEPGRLVNIDTLQQLYRGDLAGIDFMRGDEPYKQRLSTSSRRVLRLRAIPPALLPRIRHAAWCTGFEVKQWVRQKAGRTPVETLDLTLPISQPAV